MTRSEYAVSAYWAYSYHRRQLGRCVLHCMPRFANQCYHVSARHCPRRITDVAYAGGPNRGWSSGRIGSTRSCLNIRSSMIVQQVHGEMFKGLRLAGMHKHVRSLLMWQKAPGARGVIAQRFRHPSFVDSAVKSVGIFASYRSDTHPQQWYVTWNASLLNALHFSFLLKKSLESAPRYPGMISVRLLSGQTCP